MVRASRYGLLAVFLIHCTNKEIPTGVDCTQTPLNVPNATITDATSCAASDGQVTVSASGGVAPYQYAFNNGTFQDNPTFTGLSAGQYPVEVKDSRGCTAGVQVTVSAAGSTLSASTSMTPDTQCFPPDNGALEVIPAGGVPPYEIKLGNGAFGSATTFNGLEAGAYSVVVKDAANCSVTLNVNVPRGDTGVSYSSDVQSIIASRCAVPGCHVSGTSVPNFSTYSGVSSRAQNIKLRTSNGSMPPAGSPDLTTQQIQLIACWVDDGAKNN
ncbi:MAG: SprB repeat-containing protein [Cyclobacteriaceae bacterium]|nr:SprB repeat-containing protein [Cyclobacteriaceae bacterium]